MGAGDERGGVPATVERDPLAPAPDEPPVVARLVVEIRSDGTRTIARGMVEDLTLNEKVGIEMQGTSPAALAASLAKSVAQLPLAVLRAPGVLRTALRALRPGSKDE